MATKYQEALGAYEAKLTEVHRIIDEKPDYSWTDAEVETWQAGQKELADLNTEVQKWRVIDEQAIAVKRQREEWRRPVDRIGHNVGPDARSEGEQESAFKTLGELFAEHELYKANRGRTNAAFGVDMPVHTARTQLKAVAQKATITSAAGFAPFVSRRPRVIEAALRRPVVGDLMPNTNITDSAVKYMEETTTTNNAAVVAENAEKPESALAWTERTIPVEVIATYIPITEQQLEDAGGIQSTIDNRLTMFLMLAEESQLLNGNGTSPNLHGFYNKSGVQTQSGAGIEAVEAVYKAFTKVRHTGFAEPSGVVIHPNDWEAIRLMRADGATGVYLFGNPSEAGPETLWGKDVVVTTAATENTALTGDFGLFSELFRKQGIRIEVGRINTDFIFNRMTIRAEERVALAIYRGAAFCKVTNI